MTAYRIKVDWVACDGRGVCAELLPERISLDDWGYPIIDPRPVEGKTLALARKTVAVCPKLALSLVPAEKAAPVPMNGNGDLPAAPPTPQALR